MNISQDNTHHIMRDIIRFKSYMMHSNQQLYDEDMNLRVVEMSKRLIPTLEDPANKGNVFFSNESSFYVSGMMNKLNCPIWVANNPFITVETAMNSPKINVWCTMSSKQIIAPWFLKETKLSEYVKKLFLSNFTKEKT